MTEEKKQPATTTNMIPQASDFHPGPPMIEGAGGSTAVEMSRAQAEVQAALISAKRFPRDPSAAFTRIMIACKRPSLAKVAEYAYPRGNQMVADASIRLAEVLAQNWGNIQCGITEVSRREGSSEIMAFCWDLETNYMTRKTFWVKHERHTRKGVTTLTDPRDIYETTANLGARRLRACILATIPRDVKEAAQEACRQTLSGKGEGPLEDRIRKMVVAFEEKFQVPQEAIELRLGHPVDRIDESELLDMIRIYNSLRDGIAKREAFFKLDTSQTGDAQDLNERFGPGSGDASEPEASDKK